MSESKFTPGPWSIVRYGDGDSLVIHAGESDWRVCFMATPGSSPRAMDTISANAALIAAAPELYGALIYALPIVEKYAHTQGDNAAFHAEITAPIRAALLKATSEHSDV